MSRAQQNPALSGAHWRVVPRVLCFVRHGGDVLLLKGAPTKRIWANLYNGLGGHVEADEDVYSAVVREVHEESGLAVVDVRLRGVTVVDAGDPAAGILFFTFTARAAERSTRACPEGTLEWVPAADVGALDLVEDLRVMLPRILAMPDGAPPYFARYSYDEAGQLLIAVAPGQGLGPAAAS